MSADLIAVVVVGIVYGLDRFGLIPKRQATEEALNELALNDRTIERLEAERDKFRSLAEQLERERSNEPVMALVQSVFETQQATLEKLAHFNGALRRQEEGLREATEALKFVAGLFVGAADVAVKKPV